MQVPPFPLAEEAPGRLLLVWLFDAVLRMLFRLEVRGLEHYHRRPETLIVATHRSDADGPLLASALLRRRGGLPVGPLPYFVAREDLFRRGFLREYLTGWPRWLSAPLGRLDLCAVLRYLKAFPIRRIPERSLRETLEDVRAVVGEVPLDKVLRPAWYARFLAAAPEGRGRLGLREALRPRYAALLDLPNGFTKLTRGCFRAIKPSERAVIEAQLQRFVDLLDAGATVQLEPEGVVSTDGSFRRVRNGLYALLTRTASAPRVLPVGITYDFMSAGRPRVFINVGAEMSGLERCSRREVNARVSRAIQSLSTVTASQLASRCLLRRAGATERLSLGRLDASVLRQARLWARTGIRVDRRLLDEDARLRRLRGYLRYCERIGVLTPDRACRSLRVTVPPAGDAARGRWAPLRFVDRELEALGRVLGQERPGS